MGTAAQRVSVIPWTLDSTVCIGQSYIPFWALGVVAINNNRGNITTVLHCTVDDPQLLSAKLNEMHILCNLHTGQYSTVLTTR